MTAMNVEQCVALLAWAHRGADAVSAGGSRIRSTEDAYRVQEGVLASLGTRRPAAWKVSPPRAGADPVASPVPSGGVVASPAALPVEGRRILGIEAEVAFRFSAAPPPDAQTVEGLAAVVGEAVVLLELCATRLADFEGADALWRLADFQSHEAFVTGTGTRDWRTIDWTRQRARLFVNDVLAVDVTASHPSGDPSVLLPWAARHCASRGMALAAGDIVTLGTWTGLTRVAEGDRVAARFDGIGEATATIGTKR